MRINVEISDKLNDDLNEIATRYGMSRSSLIAFICGQFIDNSNNQGKEKKEKE